MVYHAQCDFLHNNHTNLQTISSSRKAQCAYENADIKDIIVIVVVVVIIIIIITI